MAGKAIVVMIHGLGKQDDGFWAAREQALRDALIARQVGKNVQVEGFRYSMHAQKHVNRYWESIDADLDYRKVRRLALEVVADATVYGNRARAAESNYRTIHAALHRFLKEAMSKLDSVEDRLVIWAQSFGCHVVSNFIYDNQTGRGAHDPTLEGSPSPLPKLEDLDNRCRLLITTGCNLPLFAAGHPDPVPFARPNNEFEWTNIYDKDDVLGWPIRPLGGGFENDWISDHEEDTGWSVGSHLRYWFDRGVLDRIAGLVGQI